MIRRACIAAAAALWASIAQAATPYPCDFDPKPIVCYSTEKLVEAYAGSAITVEKQTNSTSTSVGFVGSRLDLRTLNSFLLGTTYARVTRWFDQMGSADAVAQTRISTTGNTTNGTRTISNIPAVASLEIGMAVIGGPFSNGSKITNIDGFGNVTTFDAAESTTTGTPLIFTLADTPRIKPINIGPARALLFEGGSQSGRVFGLNIPSITLSPKTYTVIMVVRPTSSAYRNQLFTPGLADSGTVLSLEAMTPFGISGDTTFGSDTILNVTPIANVQPGMLISTGFTGAFPDPVPVLTVTPTTGTLGTVTVGTFNAVTTGPATLLLTNPLARFYANGDEGPGAFSATDHSTFTFEPQDTMVENDAVVMAFTSDATGLKQWQNEVIRSTGSLSARTEAVTSGYLGRMGLSRADGVSKAGDFWAVAVLIYDTALTEQQRAVVSAALYERFTIRQGRSRPSAKNVLFVGDSIAAGYTTNGLYGMAARLQDMLPDVRVGNYAVPGSQVTAFGAAPAYAYTQGMFPTSVAPILAYSKAKNILVVAGAGGNDMVAAAGPFNVALTVPGTTVTAVAHGLAVGGRVTFNSNGDTLPTGVAFGSTYWVKTTPTADTFTISASPSGSAISFSGSQSGTHQMISWPKTAAGIYAGILSVVQQGLTAGAAKVFVMKVLPRTGTVYDFILADLNTLIVAGAEGAGGNPAYSVIDPYTDSCLATNPGSCYPDGTHLNDDGHARAAQIIYVPVSAALN